MRVTNLNERTMRGSRSVSTPEGDRPGARAGGGHLHPQLGLLAQQRAPLRRDLELVGLGPARGEREGRRAQCDGLLAGRLDGQLALARRGATELDGEAVLADR